MEQVKKALQTITTGYHYRRIIDFLTAKSKDYYLFFSEILSLGEKYYLNNSYTFNSSLIAKIRALETGQKTKFKQGLDRFGSIYYNTFGNLIPKRLKMFPQELTNLFKRGWTSGELINEFKIKIAYHSFKRRMPASLLGEFCFEYLNEVGKKYYSQNYKKDYFSTYFIIDIFNNSYINKIIKKMQKKGYIRIK